MSFTLGFQPERLTVKLPRFGDFVSALIHPDADGWPVDTQIELRFYANDSTRTPAATWPATIVGQRAEWHITEAEIAAVRDVDGDDDEAAARLFYKVPGTELEWATGSTRDVK